MKHLIAFGEEGFIGRHLAALLLKDRQQVTSVDLSESNRSEGANRRFVAADVRCALDDDLSVANLLGYVAWAAQRLGVVAGDTQPPVIMFYHKTKLDF